MGKLKLFEEWDAAQTVNAGAGGQTGSPVAAAAGAAYLMDTLWDQASYNDAEYAFNKYCPYIVGTTTHSYVGCTNTMSAQIVYYWIQKKGFALDLTLTSADNYTTETGIVINASEANATYYGYLSFSSVNSMLADFYIGPDPNGGNDDIGALSFAMGVKSQAEYGYADGTGTSMLIAPVLREIGFASANTVNHDYFWNFQSDSTGIRYNITNEGWGVIKDNLSSGYVLGVMIYSSEITHHAVAIDGYDSTTNSVHVNFGWGPDSVKEYDVDTGLWSGTGWYTKAEFEALQPSYFLVDLIGVYTGGSIAVKASGVYGVGTLNRVIEQANGMAGSASIVFNSSLVGSTIALTQSTFDIEYSLTVLDFRSTVNVTASGGASGYVFHNDNATADFVFGNSCSGTMTISAGVAAAGVTARSIAVNTTFSGRVQAAAGSGAGRGFTATGDIAFDAFSGSIVASSEQSNAAGIYTVSSLSMGTISGVIVADSVNTAYALYSNDAVALTVTNGILYGGSYLASGSTYARSARQLETTLAGYMSSGGAVAADIIASASGYAIRSGTGDDILTLTGRALLLGNIYLGTTGNDALVMGSESRIYGNITAGSLDVVFNLGRIAANAMITCDNPSALTAGATDYTINLSGATDGTYTLISTSGSLAGLYTADKTFTVVYGGVTYAVKISDNFDTYDFIDINVVGSNQLAVVLQNVANQTGGLKVTPSTTEITNQDVILTLNPSEHYTQIQYSFDNATWNIYAGSVTVAQNGPVYFRMLAADGSIGYAEYSIANIDKTPPTVPQISASTTALTKEDVILTAIFDPGAVRNEFSRDGVEWVSCNGKVTVNENSTIYFRSFDAAGNMSSSNYTVNNIDLAGPSFPVVTLSEDGPTRNDVIVSATFDRYSIANYYSFDGKLWRPYVEPLVMTRNGTVYFRSVDDDYEVATVKTVISNIDRTPPSKPKISTQWLSEPTTTAVVTARFDASAALNEYSLDGGYTWQRYTGPLHIYMDTRVSFRSIDAAGNESKVATANLHQKEWTISNLVTETADDAEMAGTLRWAVARANDGAYNEVIFADNLASASIVLTEDLIIDVDLTIAGATTVAGNRIIAEGDLTMNGWNYVRNEASAPAPVYGLGLAGGLQPVKLIGDEDSRVDITNTDGDAVGIHNDASKLTMVWKGALEVSGAESAIGLLTEGAAVLGIEGTLVADARIGAVGVMAGGAATLTVKGIVAAGNYAPTLGVDVAQVIADRQDYAALVDLSTGSAFIDGSLNADGTLRLGANDNTVYAAAGALIFGDLVLAGGANQLVIESGAQVYGNVTGDNLAFKFVMKDVAVEAMLSVTDSAPILAADTTFTVDATTAAAGVSILIDGITAAELTGYQFTVVCGAETVVVGLNESGWFQNGNAECVFTVDGNLLQFSWQDWAPPTAPTVSQQLTSSGSLLLTARGAADAARQEFSRDGGLNWETYTGPVEVNANGEWLFRSLDASGNIGDVTAYEVDSLDGWRGILAEFGDTLTPANMVDGYALRQLTAGRYALTGDFGDLSAKISLYNADGKKVASGSVKNGALKFNSVLLAAGDYSLVVERTGRNSGDYTLAVEATRFIQGNNGDDLWDSGYVGSNAIAIGTLAAHRLTTIVADGWVGFGDAVDYIRLDVGVGGVYDLLIDNLRNGARLTVYSANDGKLSKLGQVMVKNGDYGFVNDLLLDAGREYYLKIEALKPAAALNTDYTIAIGGTQTAIVRWAGATAAPDSGLIDEVSLYAGNYASAAASGNAADALSSDEQLKKLNSGMLA